MSPIKGECSIIFLSNSGMIMFANPNGQWGPYEIEVRSNMIIFTLSNSWSIKKLMLWELQNPCIWCQLYVKDFDVRFDLLQGKTDTGGRRRKGKKLKKRKEKKKADSSSSSSIAALLLRIRQRRLGSRVKRTSGVKRVENLCGILCSPEDRHCGVHSTFLLG